MSEMYDKIEQLVDQIFGKPDPIYIPEKGYNLDLGELQYFAVRVLETFYPKIGGQQIGDQQIGNQPLGGYHPIGGPNFVCLKCNNARWVETPVGRRPCPLCNDLKATVL